jgi:hypothetical protein
VGSFLPDSISKPHVAISKAHVVRAVQVKELHPYDEPEVIGLPVVGGSSSYLQWVMDNTAAAAAAAAVAGGPPPA